MCKDPALSERAKSRRARKRTLKRSAHKRTKQRRTGKEIAFMVGDRVAKHLAPSERRKLKAKRKELEATKAPIKPFDERHGLLARIHRRDIVDHTVGETGDIPEPEEVIGYADLSPLHEATRRQQELAELTTANATT